MGKETVLEDFTKCARKLYDDVGANRFLLPGHHENGTVVEGYEIIRSIAFDDKRGFAIGWNPDAVSQLVCWQFTAENGGREFYWGIYDNNLANVENNYIARVMVHMESEKTREVYNPLAAAEMSAEQNYNQIDGVINNEKPRLDLTDGQTYEEVAAIAPGTLAQEKPSVLEQIRSAQKAPKPPRKEKSPEQKKHKGGPER